MGQREGSVNNNNNSRNIKKKPTTRFVRLPTGASIVSAHLDCYSVHSTHISNESEPTDIISLISSVENDKRELKPCHLYKQSHASIAFSSCNKKKVR